MLLVILLLELIVIFFLSRHITEQFYRLFLVLFRHRIAAITATTILFFPGTVVHELAHLFVAEILGVRTGKLSLVPENLEEEEVQAGSVQIAHTDPFRRYLIGFAPLFVGVIILTALSYMLPQYLTEATAAVSAGKFFSSPATYIVSLIVYLLFVLSNSMFSSREDLKGFWPFAIVIGLLITAGYIAGIRVGLTTQAIAFIDRILYTLVQSTGIVLAINIILLLTILILVDLSRRMIKKKIN